MSTPNNGGPAFPQHGWTTNPEVLERMKNQGGMALRDWFAGQALNGLFANLYALTDVQRNQCPSKHLEELAAHLSFAAADAMLKARGQ